MNKKKRKLAPFVPLDRQMLRGKEYKELANSEKVVYTYLKLKYNGHNNGDIALSYGEMKGVLGSQAFAKALRGLKQKGWITITKHGGLYRYYNLFKLTGKYDPSF